MKPVHSAIALFLSLAIIAVPLCIYRLVRVIDPRRPKAVRHGRAGPAHLLIVLGSGGHTAEMLAMLGRSVGAADPDLRLEWYAYTHRTWVVSSGDAISAQRAREFEAKVAAPETQEKGRGRAPFGQGTFEVVTVPRARNIYQSALSTPVSCMRCLATCWGVLVQQPHPHGKDFPDLILCNGPATATVLLFTSMLLRFFDVRGCHSRGKMRTIYVESWARVKRLSLSGKLLCRVVDRFLVQWPQLEASGRVAGGRAEFVGGLVY